MEETSSYRRILWATSVVGGATLAALLIGLIRNKAIALIGGPSAVGLLGLFTALVAMGASVSTLGLDTSAVRQLSQSADDREEAGRVRWAIWTLAWPLAVAGGAIIWLFRAPLARLLVQDANYSGEVGWLGIGVAATVVAASQMAILQGYSRIGDLARVRLGGSILATLVAVAAVYRFGMAGIVVAVLATPLANCLFAAWYGRTIPGKARGPSDGDVKSYWKALAAIGTLVMLTNAVASLTQLATRSLVTQELGLDAAGFYHACYAVVAVNLSLILNAMAADFYPRLSRVADDPNVMTAVLNQQIHVGLVLAAPVLAAVSLAAPLVLQILYSSEFSSAEFLLRLLIAAGLLRLPIWALGFVFLARGAGVSFLIGEVAAASMIPLAWLLIDPLGLSGAGAAAVLASIFAFAVYLIRVRRAHGVTIDQQNLLFLALTTPFLIALALSFEVDRTLGYVLGGLGTAGLAWHSISTLRTVLKH
jgi:PST family polysaccharide transporter